jgi:Sulfatase-modifying factor enzyme 1
MRSNGIAREGRQAGYEKGPAFGGAWQFIPEGMPSKGARNYPNFSYRWLRCGNTLPKTGAAGLGAPSEHWGAHVGSPLAAMTAFDRPIGENRDRQGTSPVGTFSANGFNLYDTAGNVFEWVADWYDEDLYATRSPHSATVDPQVYRSDTGKRMVRGGSWQSIPPRYARRCAGCRRRMTASPISAFAAWSIACPHDPPPLASSR